MSFEAEQAGYLSSLQRVVSINCRRFSLLLLLLLYGDDVMMMMIFDAIGIVLREVIKRC